MMMKQQQQEEEDVKTSPATKRAVRRCRGKQARQRALTQHFVGLFLFIKLNNYFILFKYYHLSLSAECFVSVRRCLLASAADTSVDRRHPPSSITIAQCSRLPWPILEAGAH
jgi:hypothetical protein